MVNVGPISRRVAEVWVSEELGMTLADIGRLQKEVGLLEHRAERLRKIHTFLEAPVLCPRHVQGEKCPTCGKVTAYGEMIP